MTGEEVKQLWECIMFCTVVPRLWTIRCRKGLHRQMLNTRRKILEVEAPSTLRSTKNLAMALSNQGKYAGTEKMHRETLRLRKKTLEEKHIVTLRSKNNLAAALNYQGKHVMAETIHREIVQLSHKVQGRSVPRC